MRRANGIYSVYLCLLSFACSLNCYSWSWYLKWLLFVFHFYVRD